MKTFAMAFDGELLRRGFWLYVWKIDSRSRTVLYVGRTGDSSSRHASSPFRRNGQHLDLRSNAKANALARRLKDAGLDAHACRFEMLAFGPLFPEQDNLDDHRVYRDRAAALEGALAVHLKQRGFEVVGTHPRQRPLDDLLNRVFGEVRDALDRRLPRSGDGWGA